MKKQFRVPVIILLSVIALIIEWRLLGVVENLLNESIIDRMAGTFFEIIILATAQIIILIPIQAIFARIKQKFTPDILIGSLIFSSIQAILIIIFLGFDLILIWWILIASISFIISFATQESGYKCLMNWAKEKNIAKE